MKDALILSQTDGEKETIMYRTPFRSSSAFLKEGILSRRCFWKRFLSGLAALGLFLGAVGQARSQLMYWSDFDGGDIRRANLDGSGQQILFGGLDFPQGSALDLAGGKIYWANPNGGDIRR